MDLNAKNKINYSTIPSIITPTASNSNIPLPKHEEKVAGSYKIEKTIGKGNYAVVKLAHHVFTGQKVAIKIIDKTKLDLMSKIQLFQEVNCMKLVRHPNVVKLYEVVDTPNKLYLILELGTGGDLYDYILKYDRGIVENKAREYFRQLLNAIIYCHKMHVVHRDLKPENVIFFDHHETVKLTDFGFSNKFKPGQKLETSCGSLAYSAPEILLGDQYDAQAIDIWSLGVLLYMLVVGRCPFLETNDNETITMIIDCKYTVPPHISPQCRDLIGKMLVKEPSKRAKLDEIMNHPWLSMNLPNDGSGTIPINTNSTPTTNSNTSGLTSFSRADITEDINRAIINKMVGGGIATEHQIKQSLKRDCYNHVTATYYLLAEKMLKYKASHAIGATNAAQQMNSKSSLSIPNKSNQSNVTTTSTNLSPAPSPEDNNNSSHNNAAKDAKSGQTSTGNQNTDVASSASSSITINQGSTNSTGILNTNNNHQITNYLGISPDNDYDNNINNIQLIPINKATLDNPKMDDNTLGADLFCSDEYPFLNGDPFYKPNGMVRRVYDSDVSDGINNIKNLRSNALMARQQNFVGDSTIKGAVRPAVGNNNVSSSSLPELMSSTTPANFARDLAASQRKRGDGNRGVEEFSPSSDQFDLEPHNGGTGGSSSPVSDICCHPKHLLTRQSYDGAGYNSLNRASPKPLSHEGSQDVFFNNKHHRCSSPVLSGGSGGGAYVDPMTGALSPPPPSFALQSGSLRLREGRLPKSPTLSLGTPANTCFNPLNPLNRSSFKHASSSSSFSRLPSSSSTSPSYSYLNNANINNKFVSQKHGSVDNITNLTSLNQYIHPKHQTPQHYFYTKLLAEERFPPPLLTSATIKLSQPPYFSDKKVLPSSRARRVSPVYNGRFSDPTPSSSSTNSETTLNSINTLSTTTPESLLTTNEDKMSSGIESASPKYSKSAVSYNLDDNKNLESFKEYSQPSYTNYNLSNASRYLFLSGGTGSLKKSAAIPSRICEENEPPPDEDVPKGNTNYSSADKGFKKFHVTPFYDNYSRGTDLQMLQTHHQRSNSLTEPNIDQLLNDRLAKIRLYSNIHSVGSSPNFSPSNTLTTIVSSSQGSEVNSIKDISKDVTTSSVISSTPSTTLPTIEENLIDKGDLNRLSQHSSPSFTIGGSSNSQGGTSKKLGFLALEEISEEEYDE